MAILLLYDNLILTFSCKLKDGMGKKKIKLEVRRIHHTRLKLKCPISEELCLTEKCIDVGNIME